MHGKEAEAEAGGWMDRWMDIYFVQTITPSTVHRVTLGDIEENRSGQGRTGQGRTEQVEKQLENEEKIGEEQYLRGVPRDRNGSKKDKEDEDW